VVSTEGHGISFWANTGRIDVELADGAPQSFFIKVVSKEVGKNMVHGEFESMKAIYTLLPDFAPRPIAWGAYETILDTHFFLCEYREMIDEMPDPHKFTARLAALHQNSKSPNGKFGFHETTYSGNLPQMNEWEESWETYFTKSMRWALKLELEAKGPSPEFDVLVPAVFDKVIPRLLRPLESEGRSVKPSLVHGDLWYANSGIDMDTDESLIFDACCFYAHNECKSNSDPKGRNLTRLTHTCFIKMSLVNGGQSATDLGQNTWQHTTPMFKYPHLKRITMAA
jgi:protein-ribulosamine 3-kinase